MQLSCDYKAITAVISLAANHAEASGGRIYAEGKLCDGRAGILHQRERGHPKLLGGYAINLPHLGRGNDLHGSYQLSAVSHQLKPVAPKDGNFNRNNSGSKSADQPRGKLNVTTGQDARTPTHICWGRRRPRPCKSES